MISWHETKPFLCEILNAAPSLLSVQTPLLVCKALITLALPFASGHLFDALINDAPPLPNFLLFAFLVSFHTIFEYALQYSLLRTSRIVEFSLQSRILKNSLQFSPAKLDNTPHGEIVAKLTRDAGVACQLVNNLYPRLVTTTTLLSTASLTLFYKSAWLGLAFVFVIVLALAVYHPFKRLFKDTVHTVRITSDKAFNTLFEFFNVLPFLRTLAAEKPFSKVPLKALAALRDTNGDNDAVSTKFNFASGILMSTGEIIVVGTASFLVWRDTIPIGDMIACQILFLSAVQSVQGIAFLLPEVSSIQEGFSSLHEMLVPSPGNTNQNTGHTPPPQKILEIKCNHITFAYPGSQTNVISDFSASIPGGSVVCISGSNGAGKTTLLKILIGVLAPNSGLVTVNGIALENLDTEELHRQIGAVFQNNLLFSGTIRENITLRDPRFSENDIKNALALSGADEITDHLPDGLNTAIGYGGTALSGGEMQKIAIARALLRKPELLILDEVTNHLDSDSRAKFTSLLDTFRGQTTTLVVSHDPAVIAHCDLNIHLAPPSKAKAK